LARGVVHIQWYATVFRGGRVRPTQSAEVAAPAALGTGATRYTVQRSQDDGYRIVELIWFESKDDWYRYWEGPEMREFPRPPFRASYQVPLTYIWHDEYRGRRAPPAKGHAEGLGSGPDPEPSTAA